jgi:hypothetical protein
LSDISAITGSEVSHTDCLDIITFELESHIYMATLAHDSIKIGIKGSSGFSLSTKMFAKESCLTASDNIYEGRMFIVPPSDESDDSGTSKIYAPGGVVHRYSKFYSLVISLPSDDGFMSYEIMGPSESSNGLDYSRITDGDGNIVPSDFIPSDMSCSEMRYCIGGNKMAMNLQNKDYANILAAYKKTMASKAVMGQGSKAIRSMSLYVPYQNQD